MDLKDHLEAYRASLRRDVLEGCVEYSKLIPTGNTALYPTAYHYIEETLRGAKEAAAARNVEHYQGWLLNHQRAMIALFERMVDEILFGQETATVEMIWAMIEEKGWNWFKFCKKSLVITLSDDKHGRYQVTVVPRMKAEYSPESQTLLFDATEMSGLTKDRDRKLVSEVVEAKRSKPGLKFLPIQGIYMPWDQINDADQVGDWAAELFPKQRKAA